MVKSKTPHLILFFSYDNSLRTWAETGLMSREILLYKTMIQQGYKVSFVTYGDTDDYRYSKQLEGINIIPVFRFINKSKNRWINLFKSFFIPFNISIRNKISDADIYKTNQMVGSWVPVLASIMNKKTLIVRCGYEMLRNMLRDEKNPMVWVIKAIPGYALECLCYLIADKIIISNNSDRNYIKRLFPVKDNKLLLIRNFIDTDLFSTDTPASIGEKKKKTLYIGRLESCKNIENLICGSSQTDCALDIVGTGSKAQALQSLANKQKGEVNFLGRIENKKLPAIIKQYDLYILPSLFEGNPKTLLEAMACARVVLGTNVAGIKELIDDGETGFLCETDSESIKDAIQTICDTPDEKLRSIAQNAREFVEKECSIEKVLSQEMRLYKELLHE